MRFDHTVPHFFIISKKSAWISLSAFLSTKVLRILYIFLEIKR
uniref:Uncharacterized protein n=1 Tax=Anguilla anguilla TaxID=7936 RepID=A0A0E9TGC6_ANGAN